MLVSYCYKETLFLSLIAHTTHQPLRSHPPHLGHFKCSRLLMTLEPSMNVETLVEPCR